MGSKLDKRVFVLLAIVVASMLPFFLESKFNITGFSTFNEEALDLSYNSNSVNLWKPLNDIPINYIALTGNVTGTGEFKVYIIDEEPHLLLDFNLNGQTVLFDDYSLENYVNLKQLDKYFLRVEVGNGELNLNDIYYSDSVSRNGSFEIIGLATLQSNNGSVEIIWQDVINSEGNNLDIKKTTSSINTLSLNTSLEISNLEFDPYSPNQYEDVLVLGKYEDDGSLDGTIEIEFYVNSLNVFNDSKIVESGSNFNFTLEKGNFTLGDNLSIIITANDSENTTQKQLEAIIGQKGPVINSITKSFEVTGLGVLNEFFINATDGNNTIDSVWGNVINRKENISLTFENNGGIWNSSYLSFVLGNHTLDVYVNDTNGIIEHELTQYTIDSEILLRIETEKDDYILNEEVRIEELR